MLDQGYPSLEYVVVDGGSSDDSPDIIRRFEGRLAWWRSEPDNGQYDAINKGFAKTGGEIMGWLNSDDMHMPWTLSVVAEIFQQFPEIEWLTSLFPLVCDRAGRMVRCAPRGPFNRHAFFKGDNLPRMGAHTTGWIQQESTFWRRSLWDRAGGRLDASLQYAGDFDLWARFSKLVDLHAVDTPLAGFRRHGNQKTGMSSDQYQQEALRCLIGHGGSLRGKLNSSLVLANKRICPNRLKPMMARLGLLSSGKVCVFDTDRGHWNIVER